MQYWGIILCSISVEWIKCYFELCLLRLQHALTNQQRFSFSAHQVAGAKPKSIVTSLGFGSFLVLSAGCIFPALSAGFMFDVFFCPPDKMEAAAAVITSQRSSTGGNNTTASSESQNATPAAVKTNTTGSETAQTTTAASSTTSRTAGSTQVSSSVHGMLACSANDRVSFGASCLTHRILQSFFLSTH